MQVVYEVMYFIICYLIGSIPSGLIIGKMVKHIDIREYGSGNLGGTNAIRVLGKRWGSVVAVMDTLKGGAAILLAQYAFHSTLPVIIFGITAVIGHVFPIFAKFKGGKAVATSGGVLLFYSWPIFFFGIIVFIITVKWTRYVSVGSTAVAVSILAATLVIYFWFQDTCYRIFHIQFNLPYLLTIVFLVSFIFYRHIPNYKRLLQGNERKIGEKHV